MESSMIPSDRILGITAMRRPHLVEGSYPIALLELGHPRTDGLDVAGDIIAMVQRGAGPP